MEAFTRTYAPFRTQKWQDFPILSAIGVPWPFHWDLCTVAYFGHIGDRLKAVFDPAESPSRQPFPRGELDVLLLLVGDSDAVSNPGAATPSRGGLFTSNLPNGNSTFSPCHKASVIVSKTAVTTASASLRLSSLGFQADLSTPWRFGEIAFTKSRRVKNKPQGRVTFEPCLPCIASRWPPHVPPVRAPALLPEQRRATLKIRHIFAYTQAPSGTLPIPNSPPYY
jgi:hypothetical protein